MSRIQPWDRGEGETRRAPDGSDACDYPGTATQKVAIRTNPDKRRMARIRLSQLPMRGMEKPLGTHLLWGELCLEKENANATERPQVLARST